MNSKRLVTVTTALVLLFCPSLTLAEQPPPDTSAEETKAFNAMFGQGPQEEDVYRTDRLLVTATGSLKPLHLAPSVATVITAEDIQRIGATSLDEVLETVPGLHVVPSGNWFSSIWSIRGVHTSINPEALMLVNGVPLAMNYTGGRPLTFRLPVEMISRVEVVRGPGSALYGADAFSGVINVITKDNFEIAGTQAGARGGSFDTYDGWLQHGGQYGGQYGGWDLALGLEWQKSTAGDRIVEQDRLSNTPFAKLSNTPGPLDTQYDNLDTTLQLRRGDLDFHLYGSLHQAGAGPGGSQAITYGNDLDNSNLLTDLSYRNDHSCTDWELGGRIYYSYINADALIEFFPKGFPPAFTTTPMQGEPIQTGQDGGMESFAVYSGISSHRVRLGAGFKSSEFTPDQYKNFNLGAPPTPILPSLEMVHIDPAQRYITDANRQLWYGLIQDEWHLASRWELTAGVRYDHYSDFGATTNPRAALVWETLPELTTKLLYGQAFRAPSFSEQYITNNPNALANPDLVPGEIETMELAFDYQPKAGLRTTLNLFTTTTDGMVHLIKLPGEQTATFHNYDDLRSHGFEVEMEWQPLEPVTIKTNFAYQRSKNTRVDAMVPDAPEMQFYLNPHWQFMTDWSVDGQYFWIGDRHREKADPRETIDDYQVVNLTLRRENIGKHWEAAVAVRNLFDEGGREPSPYDPLAGPQGAFIPGDYPIASRSIWAEARFHY